MIEKAIEEAADFVAFYEGFQPEPYVCPGGVLSFGYGSLESHYPNVEFPISEAKARQYLMKDLRVAYNALKRLVTVELNLNQQVALLSLIHNIGQGAFEKSKLRELLNQSLYKLAAMEFNWYRAQGVVQPGLVERRQAEKVLFLRPIMKPLGGTLTNLDFLKQQMTFEGLAGYYKVAIFKHLFNIGKPEHKEAWGVSLEKAELYLNELKKLTQEL